MKISKLEKYKKYKSGEIDWLGEFPAHWEARRIKDLSSLQSGDNIISEQIEETGLYPVYGGGGLRGYFSDYTNDGNHILIGRQGALCGNINYGSGKFWASEHAVVVYEKRYTKTKWYGEMLRVMNLNQYSVSAAQPGLAVDRIKRLLLPVAPLEEQQAIADYLDAKTKQIDRKIELLDDKAEKYADLKQSLINETITRGLDKNVPMKDSGVEWIGQIPSRWELKRVNDIASQQKIKNIGLREKNLLSLSYGKLKRKDIETSFGLLPESFETYQVVNKGNIILRLTDLQNDWTSLRVGLARERGIITSAYLCLRFAKQINPTFAYYVLHTYDLRKVFYWLGSGLRSVMKFDDIKVLPFLLPPLEEQNAIAEYLEAKTAHIEKIVETIHLEIEKLKELRKTLINDVVTGKIKVYDGGGSAG